MGINKRDIYLLLFAAFIALSGCNGSDSSTEPINLQFNLAVGEQYLNNINAAQTIQSDLSGNRIEIKQNMGMECLVTDVSGSGDERQFSIINKRITIESESIAGSIKYDSDDTAGQNNLFTGIQEMLRRPFRYSINNKGEIKPIITPRPLIDDGKDNTPAPDVQQEFNDSSIRSLMQLSFNFYPDKPVKPGDTWTRKYSIALGFMQVRTENFYKLTEIEKGIAHIDINSKISCKTTGTDQPMQMDLSGTQTGSVSIRVKTGLVLGGRLTQKMDGTMTMMNIPAPTTVKAEIGIKGSDN